MTSLSMTGFASKRIEMPSGPIQVDVRSVNNRFLDVSCKLPQSCQHLEAQIQAVVKKYINRGRVDVLVRKEAQTQQAVRYKFNRDLFTVLLSSLKEGVREAGLSDAAITPDVIASLISRRDVIEMGVQDTDIEASIVGEDADVLAVVDQACISLLSMREKEGESQDLCLKAFLLELDDLCEHLSEQRLEDIGSLQSRLSSRIQELGKGVGISEQRLVEEVVLLVDKCDIAEELVRLGSHQAQFLQILAQQAPKGRKLEFLLQEMSREVNTIGSKSRSSAISVLVVEAKSLLEKMREQVMNVE